MNLDLVMLALNTPQVQLVQLVYFPANATHPPTLITSSMISIVLTLNVYQSLVAHRVTIAKMAKSIRAQQVQPQTKAQYLSLIVIVLATTFLFLLMQLSDGNVYHVLLLFFSFLFFFSFLLFFFFFSFLSSFLSSFLIFFFS